MDFLSAEVQASAALTGLLFVAISINLSKIVPEPRLVSRAAKGLGSLIGIMLAGSLCLVPGQSSQVLGSELTILGVAVWVTVTSTQRAASKENPYQTTNNMLVQAVLTQLSALPLVVCGISLACSEGGGLYWIVPAVIFSLLASLIDAWVLLIEILR
jgi:modulator of FtsH protease